MKLMNLTKTVAALWLLAAVAPLSAQSGSDWSPVQRLSPGSIIAVTDESGATVRGRLLRADADSILLYAPTIDTSQIKVLDRMSREQPRLLGRVDRVALDLPDSHLRIAVDGIAKNGTRIASFDEVFRVTSRAHVVSVIRPQDQRHSYRGTIAGVAIGAVAGILGGSAIVADDTPCQPNCGSRYLAAGSMSVGGPLAGGLLGHALTRPRSDYVIYRR